MRLYESTSTPAELETNGIGNLLCEYAPVHEEINGEFSLTLKVAQESPFFDDVAIGAIVRADTPRGPQFFRLSKPTTTLDGGKEVFAWHISYDLAQDMVLNRAWTGKTGAEALPGILQAGISETRFTGTSDISLVTNIRIVRTSVLGAIIGDQGNSFVNRWGGEIERNNFTVNVKAKLGADNGVTVEYRKNLTGLTYEEDDSEIANRIVPTGLDENDTVVMLPEVYIDSDRISETPVPHVRHIHFSDIKVGAEDEYGNVLYVDIEAVRTELRIRVAQAYEQGVDLPFKSATVEFVDLSQTEEYKNYAILESVNIGDTVRCKYKTMELSQRVVSYDYDSLTKKYIRIVLGSVMPTLGDSLWAQDLDLSALSGEVSRKLTEGEVYNGITMSHGDGVVTSATIDGVFFEVKQNAQDVLAIYADGEYLGGPRVINGKAAFVGNILTNNINGNCYAEIGDYTDGSIVYTGISIYRKVDGAFVLIGHIAVNETGGLHLKSNGAQIVIQGNGAIVMHDSTRVRAIVGGLYSVMYSPNGERGFGVNDGGGAYRVDYGLVTYL